MIVDNLDALEEQIVDQFTRQERDVESDEEIIEKPKITTKEALASLKILQEYEEARDFADIEVLDFCEKWEKNLRIRAHREAKQMTLDRFWT